MNVPAFSPWPPLGSPADLLARFGVPVLDVAAHTANSVGADLGFRWFSMSEPPPPTTLVWDFRGCLVFSTLSTPGLLLGAVAD